MHAFKIPSSNPGGGAYLEPRGYEKWLIPSSRLRFCSQLQFSKVHYDRMGIQRLFLLYTIKQVPASNSLLATHPTPSFFLSFVQRNKKHNAYMYLCICACICNVHMYMYRCTMHISINLYVYIRTKNTSVIKYCCCLSMCPFTYMDIRKIDPTHLTGNFSPANARAFPADPM